MIDACVRALPASDADVQRFVVRPFRGMGLGHVFGQRFVPPIDDYSASLKGALGEKGMTDPEQVGRWLFEERGLDAAVLLPPNRILRPDKRHDVALASATNEWMAATWLEGRYEGRFFGSIHVSLAEPAAAVREIERWGADPRFVQVAVPLQVHAPYGEQIYFDVWAAAASRNLPIAIHGDGGGGIEMAPTMAGMPSYFMEHFTILPSNGMIHLASLISEGVFERLPNLRFVLTDGGFGIIAALLWRHDAKWRALKDEMPWTKQFPSEYLPEHVRFVVRRADIVNGEQGWGTALQVSRGATTLMYGSNLPMWDMVETGELSGRLPETVREAVLSGNALATYPRLRERLGGRVGTRA